eukprot:gene6971-1209_t
MLPVSVLAAAAAAASARAARFADYKQRFSKQYVSARR